MDEGMNSYYDRKYAENKYGRLSHEEELIFQQKAINKTDQPIGTSSEQLSVTNYGLSSYHKMAEWMKLAEQKLSPSTLRLMMQEYYSKWKFKHPYPEDFF